MIKILGSLFIILGCIVSGRKLNIAKRNRLDFLEKMLYSVSRFQSAVEIFKKPIEEGLEYSGINDNAKLLSLMHYPGIELDKKDFGEFIKGLDSESLEGQKSNLLLYKMRLTEEEKKERLTYKNISKLIRTSSVMLGFLFVFLLF